MSEPLAAPEKPILKVKVIGVGGAGANALEHMSKMELNQLPLLAVRTNARVLARTSDLNTIVIGARRLHGMGAGGDPDLGRAAGQDDLEKIKEAVASVDLLFLVAGLGGGTGAGLAPLIAQTAKEAGALVVGVATLPFQFEGLRRQKQAQAGLLQFKAAADAVLCFPNQKLAKLVDENTVITEAFNISNDCVAQGILGIWQLLTRPGLIHVDFAYLYSLLRGRHAESFFACAQAQGEERARELVEKLLSSPFLDEGQALAEADAVLVSLVGGPDLTMAQVNKVMEQINRRAEKGHLIMGAAIDENLSGKLSVTVVAAKHPKQEMNPSQLSSRLDSIKTAPGDSDEIDSSFLKPSPGERPPSRFVAPPPSLSQQATQQLFNKQKASPGKGRNKTSSLWRQGQLPLEIVSKGRFEKGEPTFHRGEDLDVPTFVRRGMALN